MFSYCIEGGTVIVFLFFFTDHIAWSLLRFFFFFRVHFQMFDIRRCCEPDSSRATQV